MKLISEALVAFQSDLKPVTKDSDNPFFKSSYASLSDILCVVMPILTKHKLSLIQPFRIEGSVTILQTTVIHISGEMLTSEIILPHNPDPQKQGSIISYYKRYAIQAMLCIATVDEDDDANKASDKPSYLSSSPQPQKFEAPSTAQLKYLLDLASRSKTPIENPEKLSKIQVRDMIDKLSKGIK